VILLTFQKVDSGLELEDLAHVGQKDCR
jgi:hypothetical protein